MLKRGGYWLLSAEGLVLYVENPLTEPAKIFFLPVNRVLIKLMKLPVHRVHIHVIIFLKVMQEQLNGVVASHEALVILVDFFDLNTTN